MARQRPGNFAAHKFTHIPRDPLAQRALQLLPHDISHQIAQGIFVKNIIRLTQQSRIKRCFLVGLAWLLRYEILRYVIYRRGRSNFA